MIQRYQKIYEGDSIRRITPSLLFFKAPVSGTIKRVDIYVGAVFSFGVATFNLYVGGVAAWSGGSRPSISALGTPSVSKTGLSIAVSRGEALELAVEAFGVAGIPAPITISIEIDDSIVVVTSGGSSVNNELVKFSGTAGDAVAGTGITISTDGTLASNSDTKIATEKAVKTYADALIAANDAMVYRGATDCSANPNYPAANRGDTYRVSVAGKIGGASGVVVEVGDIFICLTDSTSSGNHATVGSNWNVIQANIDGAVTGPSSSTADGIAIFDSTSGKVLKDSAVTISTDGTLASDSDSKIATEKAVKTYVDANAGGGGGGGGQIIFSDDFDDGTLDSEWTTDGASPTITESGGKVSLVATAGGYLRMQTKTVGILRSFEAKLTGTVPATATEYQGISFGNGTFFAYMYTQSGKVRAYMDGGLGVTDLVASYNSTTHAYFRLVLRDRYTVLWQTSPDGIDWKTHYTFAGSQDFGTLISYGYLRLWSSSGASVTCDFDDVKLRDFSNII